MMARPKKTDLPDVSQSIDLTAGAIERLTCPADKAQAFLRDSKAPGLRVRVTIAGAKSFVFEKKLNRQTIRRTIGDVRAWSIDAARVEAARLTVMFNSGTDPRELDRQQDEVKAAQLVAAKVRVETDKLAATTVGEVWSTYITERRPYWGELHYRDHIDKAKDGGLPSGRRGGGKQLTRPGPLAALMPLPLKDLDQATIEAWATNEGKTRPSSARLAWRLLTVFLTWCAEQPAYVALLPAKNPAKTKKAREALGKPGTKSNVLQREQLAVWFEHVRQIRNTVISTYLQITLLTGRRREEIAEMKWEDVNFQWRGIDMKDKIEGRRDVPLTPYVSSLLQSLPRRNVWVFSSPTSASGHIEEPNSAHQRACAAAGLVGLDIQALRRSFGTLCEWLDIPGGISAQIQGHAPQGVREQNYIRRPLDLLRVHHEKIEAWILEQAGIVFDANAKQGKLHAVAGGLQS